MPNRILVLGGRGFIGRHAVTALAERNPDVVIGTRHPHKAENNQLEHRQFRLETLTSAPEWSPLLEDIDVVLNCVGILRQRGRETYDRVHHLAPKALAEVCKASNKRFVHVSALGLHADAGSRFITSKLKGEAAIQAIGGDYVFARPSLLDGEGGFGAKWLRGVAQLPFFFAPMDARGQIAALDVEELGEALATLCLANGEDLDLNRSREFDLGGTHRYDFSSYIKRLRTRFTDKPIVRIPVPGLFARLFAHFCDLVHFTPFSYGHWELLRRNNVPRENRLPELLGREPKDVTARQD